jgi:hypothetical protein
MRAFCSRSASVSRAMTTSRPLVGLVAPRADGSKARHRRQVAQHRGHRHLFQQRVPDLRRAQVLGRHDLAREPMLANQARGVRLAQLTAAQMPDCLKVLGHLSGQQVGVERALRDVAEQRAALGRAGLWVRHAQDVAMRPAPAVLVLGQLVRQLAQVAPVVPLPDQSAQPASPAAQLGGVVHERQQVRTRAHDAVEVFGHELAHLAAAVAGGDCQQEDRRVVLVGAPAPANLRRARKHITRLLRQQVNRVHRVLQRQARLAHIVGSPLRAENQEPIQLLLRINQVGVAPRVVAHLPVQPSRHLSWQ